MANELRLREGPDGSTSGILDYLSGVEDTVPGVTKAGLVEDLALFLERSGLESEFIIWHNSLLSGEIKGRTP
jgi:hypothetical protein